MRPDAACAWGGARRAPEYRGVVRLGTGARGYPAGARPSRGRGRWREASPPSTAPFPARCVDGLRSGQGIHRARLASLGGERGRPGGERAKVRRIGPSRSGWKGPLGSSPPDARQRRRARRALGSDEGLPRSNRGRRRVRGASTGLTGVRRAASGGRAEAWDEAQRGRTNGDVRWAPTIVGGASVAAYTGAGLGIVSALVWIGRLWDRAAAVGARARQRWGPGQSGIENSALPSRGPRCRR